MNYEYRTFRINEQQGDKRGAEILIAEAVADGWEPHLLAYSDPYNGVLVVRRPAREKRGEGEVSPHITEQIHWSAR